MQRKDHVGAFICHILLHVHTPHVVTKDVWHGNVAFLKGRVFRRLGALTIVCLINFDASWCMSCVVHSMCLESCSFVLIATLLRTPVNRIGSG